MPETTQDAIANLIRHFPAGNETVFDIVQAADGKNVTLSIGHRQLQPERPNHPLRAESPGRGHKFNEIDGFCAYIEKYMTANTVVLADMVNLTISAVLDDRAQQGVEVVSLQPIVHPTFKPWNSIIDKELPVLDFATHCMKHRRTISHFDGRDVTSALPAGKELAFLFSQIQANSTISMSAGQGKKSINGLIIKTEIQGKLHAEPVDIPDTLSILCPLFVGCDEAEIPIDVLVTCRNQKDVVVLCTAPSLLLAMTETFEYMVERVKQIQGVVASLGSVAYRDWDYL